MKKVKEWFKEKNNEENSKLLFQIIHNAEEGEITTVECINGNIFSLGDYKIINSEEIFTIIKFNGDFKSIGFETKTKGSGPLGDSIGSCLITDINLIDSDTIEYLGFLAKSQKDIQSVISRNFSSVAPKLIKDK